MSDCDDILALGKRIGHSMIGQAAMVERLFLGLLANGHLLVEGLPGLAKTRAIKSLAKNLDAALSRAVHTGSPARRHHGLGDLRGSKAARVRQADAREPALPPLNP